MIKYRVWRLPDKEYKKGWWIHPSQIRIYPDGTVECHVWDEEWKSYEYYNCDDIIIQRYINYWGEKEIYEGDIIKHIVTINDNGLKAETTMVLDLNDIKTLELIVRLYKYKDMDRQIIKLGNIFDNPELLENK